MPGRPYGESDRVVADGVDVVLLAGGLRSNGPAPVGEQHIVAQGGGGELRLAEQLDGTAHRVGVGGLPFLHRFEQVGEQRGELLHLHGVPFDDDAIAPHGEPSVEGLSSTWRISSEAPTTRAMSTPPGAVSVVCIKSVMLAIVPYVARCVVRLLQNSHRCRSQTPSALDRKRSLGRREP